MTSTAIRIAAHALLFFLAVVVFFLGLGIGLQFNPTLGTLLWLASAGLLALNLFWIGQSRR